LVLLGTAVLGAVWAFFRLRRREVRIPAVVSSDSGDVSTGYEAVGAKRR
jgi:hypothetical protein